jgi:hypothetical protein
MGVAASELKEFATLLIQAIHFHNATRARVRRTVRVLIRDTKKKIKDIEHLIDLIEKQELDVDPGLLQEAADLVEDDHDFIQILEHMDEALVNMPMIEEAEDIKAMREANENAVEALKNAQADALKKKKRQAAEKLKEAKRAEREAA